MSNFYRIRGLATRKLSVCLSIKRVDCYKTEESSAQIFTLLMKCMTRSSDVNFVCWSACQTHGLWQNGRKICPVFTALHVMQTRSSDKNSVCLSVCPSVCLSHACIVTKQKKDLSRFWYHTKEHLSQFSEKKNGWWRATPSTWNFGSTDPHWSEIADFRPIIARSASAVTPSEKSSINANRKSTIRAFQWA